MSITTKILQCFFIGFLEVVFAEREHKVHNIVLYPEKHSWCQTHHIQQIVASPGYEPVTIDNNVCVGACYSYSIPKTEPAEPGELIGPYCDSCQPSEIKCYHVNLHADQKNVDGSRVVQKRVQIIMNCSCQSCDKIRKEDCEITDGNTLELPQNLFTAEKNNIENNIEDLPDLLDAPGQNSTQTGPHNTENDIKLKNKLKQWFQIYQNESEEVKNDEEPYTKDQKHMEKYNSVALENNYVDNLKIEKDLAGLPEDFGVEGVPSHLKGSYIGMGIHHNRNEIIADDLKLHNTKSGGSSGHYGHHSGHHPRHGEPYHMHHLGEEQQIGMNVVHLIKGPHGSMVASPVEAKLHLDSDALKPNDEGVIIDYENHVKNHHKVADLLDE